MPITYDLISLGCPKNQVDSEVIYTHLKRAGLRLSSDSGNSDVCIINTCGFIEAAKKESIENIVDIIQEKKAGKIKFIIVTGCLVNNNLETLKKEMPEVDLFLPSFDEDKIIKELSLIIAEKAIDRKLKPPKLEESQFDDCEREHFNLKSTAYLKISEGCDRTCSFCTIPKIRGRYKSKPIDQIIKEAAYLSRNGVRELIVVSQDTSYYGLDLGLKNGLYLLLKNLVKIEGIEWIRLLYLYPSKSLFTEELISIIKNEEKILKYLDMPIQHISDSVLKFMNRGETKKDIKELIDKLKNKIPEIALRTSLIAGFPGETEADFSELLQFITKVEFDNLGVFKYSDEKEAHSHLLKDKVKAKIRNERHKTLMAVQYGILEKILSKHIGKVYNAVIDQFEGKIVRTRTYFQAPDIDGCTFLMVEDFLDNKYCLDEIREFVPVRIVKSKGYDLTASIDLRAQIKK